MRLLKHTGKTNNAANNMLQNQKRGRESIDVVILVERHEVFDNLIDGKPANAKAAFNTLLAELGLLAPRPAAEHRPLPPLRALLDAGLVHSDCLTVMDGTLAENN
jgi:hypothetical protein